jgi:hypothetical protein
MISPKQMKERQHSFRIEYECQDVLTPYSGKARAQRIPAV